jgi:tetratricopeptide (TPR) repeat protein
MKTSTTALVVAAFSLIAFDSGFGQSTQDPAQYTLDPTKFTRERMELERMELGTVDAPTDRRDGGVGVEDVSSDSPKAPDFMLWKRRVDEADIAMKEGRTTDAENALKAAIAEAEGFGPEDTRLAVTLTMLAVVHTMQQRFGEAHVLAQRALAVLEQNLGPDNGMVAANLFVIGSYQVVTVQPTKAVPVLERAALVAEKSLGPQAPLVALALSVLSVAYMEKGQPAQAEPILRRAVLIAEETGDADLLRIVSFAVVDLANVYGRVGSPSAAEPLYRKALMMRETAAGRDDEGVRTVLEQYAAFLRKVNRAAEAEDLEARVVAIRAKHDLTPKR